MMLRFIKLRSKIEVEDYPGYIPKVETFALIFSIEWARRFI